MITAQAPTFKKYDLHKHVRETGGRVIDWEKVAVNVLTNYTAP